MQKLRRAGLGLLGVFLLVGTLAALETRVENGGTRILLRGETVHQVSLVPVETERGEFQRLQLPEAGVLAEVGKPEVPVYRKLIEVPEGASVQVNYRVLQRAERTVRLLPVQPSVPKIPNPKVSFAYDEAAYQTPGFYPDVDVRVTEAGHLRGHRLMLVEIFPVKYDPVRQVARLEDFEVTVEIQNANLAAYRASLRRYNDPFTAELLKTLVPNFQVGLKNTPAAEVGMLLIVPDAYLSAVQPYVEWRNRMGFHTVAVPTSVTGNTNTAIRNYILNAYSTWEVPPTFVILVGDVDVMPYFTGQGEGSPPTDLNYGLVDNNDYFPDLYVGRWSVADASQLQAVVDKILTYETTAWSNGDAWAQKAYFMASDDGSFHQVAEGTHLYCMAIVRAHGMIADSLFEYYGTGTPVATALNDGRSLAIYSGHGYEYGWAGPSFEIGDIYNLTNTDRYPMVQSYACLTGDFTVGECFMEAWLRAQDKGAAAALGSSVTSYWDEDDILQRRMFDEWFDTTFTWIMGFVNAAKFDLYQHYGNTSRVRRYFEMYNLQGDPAMDVFTLVPDTLFVSHAGGIPLGPSQLTVNVSDPSGPVAEALVAVSLEDSLLGTAWTDASGTAQVSLNLTTVAQLTVTVTAHNHRPSYTPLQVVSDAPYVALMGALLHDANEDGYLSPNESATLGIIAKNWGNQPAPNVTAYLSSDHPAVSIVDNAESLGTLEPGDSVAADPAFSFSLNENLTNGEAVTFEVSFVSSDGDTWSSPISFTAGTPVLALDHYEVADAGGNGVVDPGEAADLTLYLLNSGYVTAEAGNLVVRTQDPYVTLTDSTASFESIAPDQVVATDAISLEADPSTPVHHQATFVLVITSDFYTFTDTLTLMIGVGGHYLVWDPDPNHTSGPVIAALLDSLNLTGDYTTDLVSYAEDLPYYESVFVTVGIYSDNYRIDAGSQEASLLESYLLEHGGNLYLEGGDVWYYDPEYAGGYDFRPLFGLSSDDDGSGDLGTVLGLAGTFTEGMTFTYTGENSWIDHLNATASGAFNIFQNQSPQYYCGVAYDAGNYKTVGLSFELAGLSDGAATKLDLVRAIEEFFGVLTDVAETHGTPRTLTLYAPSPNPFSRKVSIRFALPARQRVRLEVYDVAGRRVATLFRGELNPGVHSFTWNGTDSHGRSVGQGLYFVRLQAGHRSLSRKILKLR